MGQIELPYRLPLSEVVVTGIYRRTRDEMDGSGWDAAMAVGVNVTVAVVTRADTTEHTLRPPDAGWFRTCKNTFTFKSDGRLSSSTTSSTGELGSIVKSVVTLAGSVAGAVALGPTGDDTRTPPTPLEAAYGATAAEIAAYRDHYQAEPARAELLANMRNTAQVEIAETLGATVDDALQGTPRRQELTQLIRSLTSQLAPLVEHYQAWRGSMTTSIEGTYQFNVQLDQLRGAFCDSVWTEEARTKSTTPPANLDELWNQFGVGVRAIWDNAVVERRNHVAESDPAKLNLVEPKPAKHEVIVRLPDPIQIEVLEHQHDQRVVTGRSRHLVADAHSRHQTFTLEKTWFANRGLGLSFDEDGFPAGLSTEGTSGLAAGLQTFAGLPTAWTGGVEAGGKAGTALASARQSAAEVQLAQLKQDIEFRQQRILEAGLNATEDDAVRLQRLKQLADLVSAQKTLTDADPAVLRALAAAAEPPQLPPAPLPATLLTGPSSSTPPQQPTRPTVITDSQTPPDPPV